MPIKKRTRVDSMGSYKGSQLSQFDPSRLTTQTKLSKAFIRYPLDHDCRYKHPMNQMH